MACAASAALPDRRVYEQVSPTDKNGADVIPNETRVRSAADGDRVIFASLAGFADARGIAVSSDYLAVRAADGTWHTHGISPVQEPTGYFGIFAGIEPIYQAVSSDLTRGVLRTRTPLADAPNVARAANLYLRDDLLSSGPGSWALLTDAPDLQASSLRAKPEVADASADLSHVLFESPRALTGGAPPQPAPECVAALDGSGDPDGAVACGPRLYESVAGTTRLVGVLPASEGGAPAPASQAGAGARRGAVTAGTLSDDGARAIFTVPAAGDASGGALYLRDDHGTLGTGDDESVRIDASERTDCSGDPGCGGDGLPDLLPDPAGPQPATFWAASADASEVFFTTREQLTDDDANATGDVYRFELGAAAGRRLTRLSVDREPDDGLEPDSEGVLGASADGRYVYFLTTNDQLVDGGPTGDVGGPFGRERIFAWHDGVVHEVGGVNGGDETNALLGRDGHVKSSRVSADGTRLAFVTQGTDELLSLHGHPAYDHGTRCTAVASGRCNEVYVYDASAAGGAGDLLCASCSPDGTAATADASFLGSRVGIGLTAEPPFLSRSLTDDGRFTFFNTAERLVPGDRNAAVDAYEYDAERDAVDLISSARGADDALFLDASPDGHDVFFVTRERLRSSDTDRSLDLYDARIDGVPDPGVEQHPDCEGEGCRPAPTGRAVQPLPPSMTSDGPQDAFAAAGPPAVFLVQAPSARQLRALACHGRARLTIRASRPGTLALELTARIGGRLHSIGRVQLRLRRGRTLHPAIHLSAPARRWLARHGRLRLTVTVTYSQSSTPQAISFVLRRRP